MGAFLGMRGTGSWATDQRPKSYRESILFLFPNGTAPLTAIMSKLKSESVDDPEYNWWTKGLATQRAAITGIYTAATMLLGDAQGDVATSVAGDMKWIKMTAADARFFRIGHQVLLRDASDFTVDLNAKVIAVSINGASSFIQVKLLEADDNSSYSHNISDCDTVLIIGNINAEGAVMPTGLTSDPTKVYNYTQIFRSPVSITRTARKTRLRTGDAYKEMKREALENHSIEMEKAFLFGVRSENTGDNGYPERTTDGIITMIRRDAAANVDDYTLNETYAGKEWTEAGGGETWLNNFLEVLFRYGKGEKLALCGSGALLGINNLAQSGSHMTLASTDKTYGINVNRWLTPFGVVNLLTHPLFSIETTLRNSMLIIEPQNLIYKYIDDTDFYAEGDAKKAGPGVNASRKDATDEEWLTEAGLEMHHPSTAGFLNGVGQDHA
uniref:Putative capsid protein n=1 Tax=viral metagenome TaxID=1070528 RepID=A0A6M3KQV9_9ZZZZ